MEKWTRLLVILATSLLLLAFVAVAVRLSLAIHHTLLLFALGGLVAYALDPLVERLSRGRLKRHLAVALVFIGLLAVIGLGVAWLGGQIAQQTSAIKQDYPSYKDWAVAQATRIDDAFAARGIQTRLAEDINNPSASVQATEKRVAEQGVPILRRSVGDIGESVIVLLIALYFLIFGSDMREKFNGLLPPDLQERADLWETDVNRILGGFVRGQFIIALITGAAAALGCLAIGIKIWLLIGLFVVVAALIPVFGPYIGAIPALIAALVGPTHFGHNTTLAAIAVIAWFILINEAGSKVLYPKLVGAALGLHEVLVLFVLFAGLEINGIVGVLFAAPVAAIAIVTVVHLYRFWQDLPDSLLSNVARSDARREGQHAPAPQPPEPETAAHGP
ncbi:MAG: AI-2E family transporter [Armatimonadetes bacterium]|nr:AI-2E family transporter [Armatimonadota bacterium]